MREGAGYLGGHVGNCLDLADGPHQTGDVDNIPLALPQVGEGKLGRQRQSQTPQRHWIPPATLKHPDVWSNGIALVWSLVDLAAL